jgi:predicted DNA-binding protein
MLGRMPSRRTQIYLEEALRERIDRLRARRGGTMADVVREALDRYLSGEERRDRRLAEVAHDWVGAWKDERAGESPRAGLAERARRLDY